MNLVDRHVFSQWLRIFMLSIGFILGIVLIEDIVNNLKDLLDYGATVSQVFLYYAVVLPTLLPAVLPIALLVSILFSLGQLHRNNEITALRAAGLSLIRITRAIWFAGALLSGMLLYLQAEVIPWAVEQSRDLADAKRYAHEMMEEEDPEAVGLIYNLGFYNHEANRLWFMNRFSEFNLRAFGVTVSQMDNAQRETRRWIANEGYYDDVDGYWVLLQGRELVFDPETGDPLRSVTFDQRELTQMREAPRIMQYREKKPLDLSLLELQRLLNTVSLEDDPGLLAYWVQYHSILANPLSCLIVVGIATPFAVAGVRRSPLVNVSKSISLFAAYYLLNSVSQLLGAQGALSPALAAWSPNIAMLLVAIVLMARAR